MVCHSSSLPGLQRWVWPASLSQTRVSHDLVKAQWHLVGASIIKQSNICWLLFYSIIKLEMPDHYVSIIFLNCFIIFFGTATVRLLNCLEQKDFWSFMVSKSDSLQSWLIIKSLNIYIIKFRALFVAHAFQLRNTKCFTDSTPFIIIPLLGGLQHDCLYYISRAFLKVKRR